MTYYIAENGTPQGPFEINELLARGLNAESQVWNESMAGWVKASQVPELAAAINVSVAPPTMPAQQPYAQPQYVTTTAPNGPMPKTWLVESILVTLFCCLPFGIVGIINASKVSSLWSQGNEAGYAASRQASKDAGKWTKIGFFIGLIGIVLYLLILGLGIGAAGLS
ncbi:MAG: CD225/dispanin family protein [Muribaculaceae bacterium]|nr:CD225/dispanin family protein [Muribaculaceae bacterium]